MYNRVIKDVALEDKPRPRRAGNTRIIPAKDVILGPPPSGLGGKVISNPNLVDRKDVSTTVAVTESNTQSKADRQKPLSVNELVEARVAEFEQRFQLEKEQAFKDGFERGKGKGYQDGIARVKSIENTIGALGQEMTEYRRELRAECENAVARLVTEISEAVIGEAVMKSSKELLDYNIKRCLEILGGNGKVKVRINPSDYEFAEERLAKNTDKNTDRFEFEFEPDPSITPGGCYIETGGGAIDARIESQLDQLKNNFRQLV